MTGSGPGPDGVRPEVDDALVARLAAVCLALPEVRQEQAWIGTRWRARTKVFAHVVRIVGGHPPVYAREAGADDATVVTFRSAGDELEALGAAGPPYFRPPWAPGAVGLHLDDATDWDELAELLTESYRLCAPKRLAAELDRPD